LTNIDYNNDKEIIEKRQRTAWLAMWHSTVFVKIRGGGGTKEREERRVERVLIKKIF
jgi:hypothetical protein